MAYFVALANGRSWLDETIHTAADCAELPEEGVRPVGEASVENHAEEVEWCVACDPFGDDSAGGSPDSDGDTCQVVKNDGDVCGRELPCGYHS